jgi:hypothetical protein
MPLGEPGGEMKIRRLLLLAMSLGALIAFSVPAVASASGQFLYDETEEPVPTATYVNLTSTNSEMTTTLGTFACEHIEVEGELTQNEPEGSLVENGFGNASECQIKQLGIPIKIKDVTLLKLHLSKATNTAKFTYEAEIGKLVCHFEGELEVSPTILALHVSGVLTGTSPEPCPPAGIFAGTFIPTGGGKLLQVTP